MSTSGLMPALLVGAGGFIGSVLRFALSGLAHRVVPLSTFPIGTLTVNVVGCLIIGLLTGIAESRQVLGPEMRTFVLIGILGGFTTFSTFAYETVAMLRDGEHLKAVGTVAFHVGVGLGAVWLGYALTSTR